MEEMPYVINYIKSLRIKSGRLFRHKKTEYIEILDQMVHFAQRFTEESHKDSPDETVLIGSLALWYENLTKAKLSFQKKK
jgi:hypothetical protein